MNPADHELDFPWTAPPAPGAITTLRPGLHWLRMPLPFALDHINLWLLDDRIDGVRGFTAVDCGLASDATRSCWENVFDRDFGGHPLLRVIATHFHPDHLGLADWLSRGGERSRWSAPLWMTAAEYMIGRFLSSAAGAAMRSDPEPHRRFYLRHGVPPEEAALRAEWRGERRYAQLVPAVPECYRRMIEGDQIEIGAGAVRRFRVITGFGHAPEHACLMCDEERILIAGDMVLPGISPNVSVYDVEPDGDPLSHYLASIDRLAALPADTLVLPSHGLPFVGLQPRVRQLHAHHRVRLNAALEACAQPRSAHELMPVLFPRALDPHQTGFAFGETLAHLHCLWRGGRVARGQGADGVLRFCRV